MAPTTTADLSVAPPTKAARYQSLDLWRGASCLALVGFHATMQLVRHCQAPAEDLLSQAGYLLTMAAARLWIGVPIFFVISGYCIMATLESRRRRGGSVKEYFERRFWRIYPPYWIALALSLPAIAVVEHYLCPGVLSDGMFTVPRPEALSGWQWLGNLTLTESWRYCVTGGPAQQILPNTWTLSYEEQFYVVAGLLLWLAPQKIYRATAILTAVIVAGKVVAHLLHVPVEGSLFDGRWLLIAAGILVYYRINHASAGQVKWIYALLLAGALVAAPNPRSLLAVEPNHSIERLVGFSFALLICLLYRWDAKIVGWKVLAPLAWCGQISYSIYLIHPLFTKAISHGLFRSGVCGPWETLLATVPLCFIASLAGAYAYYWLIERHFQSSPKAAARPANSVPMRRLAEPVAIESRLPLPAGAECLMAG